jgi:catechol 2,3-dioxygenase-like lactoylglutathione lyase family enzyme
VTAPQQPALQARLHHLQLLSPDPHALAVFYSRCLGMTITPLSRDRWLCQGPQRHLIIAPGATGTLGFAAYSVADTAVLDALAGRLRAAGIEPQRCDSSLFAPESVGFLDPDGNHFVFGVAGAEATASGTAGALPARLQHVVLASSNAARMLDFYCDVVGFRLSDRVVDESGAMRTCFLRTDHEHHSLAIFQADGNRLDHHCYESADWNSIRDWGDHFASMHLPVEWGPGRHGPGNNLFVFVHDPDGNWVEISAELERVAPDRPVGAWPHEERTLNSWGRGVLRS